MKKNGMLVIATSWKLRLKKIHTSKTECFCSQSEAMIIVSLADLLSQKRRTKRQYMFAFGTMYMQWPLDSLILDSRGYPQRYLSKSLLLDVGNNVTPT